MKTSIIQTIDSIISNGVNNGILHLSTQDAKLSQNYINIKNKDVINFGSCSYLGLEFDERIIAGSIDAVKRYGTQFSSSRAYVSLGLYDELEILFSQIFNNPCLVTPTTSLAHIAALPVLVEEDDLVILDHQVHSSVQTAAAILKSKGIQVELIRHNRMDLLEERIIEARKKHSKIWYMADGIYSMYGDYAPLSDLEKLLNKYDEFHLYIDDAHGMSWCGKNGCGYVLSKMELHSKMILATSLAKGFATGGAVLVFPDKELARKVRTCGGPMITSGPLQPATLGAAIASAKIHLSDEIRSMQEEEEDNIRFCRMMINKYNLLDLSEPESPIFFIGVSIPKLGYNVLQRMLSKGYYLNLGSFPAVPMKNAGIRFTITRLHTFEQIESMIHELSIQLEEAMIEEEITLPKIYQAFKIEKKSPVQEDRNESLSLQMEHYKSATDLPKQEWDRLLGNRGSFDVDGLNFLESVFNGFNELPENQWGYDYLIIRDTEGVPVLATFFTNTISKEDMLSPQSVSQIVEEKRKQDPYYLTSRVLTMGSMLTEGNHLYVAEEHPLLKAALSKMLNFVSELQFQYNAQNVLIRDMMQVSPVLDQFFMDNGFIRVAMPVNYESGEFVYKNDKQYLASIKIDKRDYWRRYIFRHASRYEVNNGVKPDKEKLKEYFSLYNQVKGKSLEVNTFALPFELFEKMAASDKWDIIELNYLQESSKHTVGVIFCYKGTDAYIPMLIGLDYAYLKEAMPYRQSGYRMLKRAAELGYKTVRFGFGAGTEKENWGAMPKQTWAYLQARDNFSMEYLYSLNSQKSSTVVKK